MLLRYNFILIFVLAEITAGFCRRLFNCPKYEPLQSNFLSFEGRMSARKCQEYHQAMFNRILKEKYDRTCKRLYGITRGTTARIIEFPHMGALGWRTWDDTWIYLCGSSLISDRFVLTAAHCTIARSDSIKTIYPEIVRLGTTNIYEPGAIETGEIPVFKEIKSIRRHPNYKSSCKYYDIALIELKDKVTFTKYVQPACLMDNSDITLTQLTATGWGALGEKKDNSADLQSTVLDVISLEQCSDTLLSINEYQSSNFQRLKKHQMCAGKMDGSTDTCQGDAGGPLQFNLTKKNNDGNMHVIVGITSFGFGCARKNTPVIYTKVGSFIDWIEETVWPDVSKIIYFPND